MNLKKVMAISIALSIAAGSTASAFTSNQKLVESLGREKGKHNSLTTQISQEPGLKMLNQSDVVRVIVELEGESVIERATARGIKIQDMSKTQVKGFQENLINEQVSVQNNIKSKGVDFNLINSFTNVVNGFSVETTLKEAMKIEELKGVKSVTIANEYERPEPLMNNSGDITDTVPTWELGYTGEGTVISIIDTGVDPSHQDMNLTNPDNAELQIGEVESIAKENNLSGTYRTTKVPYGYNYMDGNDEILDLGPGASEHGMHVAGIAAANGDIENGGIKGTAPEAQVLAMKVFGNNPAMGSTFGDVIIKAIDDSVILGADVINMSLGSTAAFVNAEDGEQKAVNRAVDNGVVVAVSAGNSNVFGSGYDNPYAENPDYGVVGAPGLATDSLQVASIENNYMTGDAVEFVIGDKNEIYPYAVAGPNILSSLQGEELKVVDCGLGGLPEHFPAEVVGNVALIQRGTYDFTSKIANAEAAGAIAVIVYNSAAGGDGLINMMYPEGGKIPAVFMGLTGGNLIKQNATNENFTISFNGKKASAPNPGAGKMSDFTSWGNTPNLEMKPEITGVGGNVWSTAQNGGYQNMSGTSMAAPNVAGGSALIVERVEKDFPELTGEAKAKMVKRIMMSTAVPHVDKGNNQAMFKNVNYTSPRRQGAGVMNLHGAATTPAIVTDSTTNECKVNLKEITGDKATFTVTVENFSDKEVSYDVAGTVQTDLYYKGYTLLEADNLLDADTGKFPISFSSNTVTVAPNGKTDLTVTVDLSNAISPVYGASVDEIFENGGYVEGFVTLTDATDANAQLSIPYMGFKGEWDEAPAIDASIYDQERYSFYGFTSIATHVGGGSYNFLGVDLAGMVADESKIGFSPNGDGSIDTITPVISHLRNMKELKVEILDSEGKVIRNLDEQVQLRKHYHDGKYAKFNILESASWDGKANNKLVKDGDYTYRVKAMVDYEGAEWQTYDFPVKVDTVAPTVTLDGVDYNDETNTLTVNAKDNNEGFIYEYALVEDGEIIAESATGVFELGDLYPNTCTLVVVDYAGNMSSLDLTDLMPGKYQEPTGPVAGDKTAPVVMVQTPEFFGFLNNNTVVMSGVVEDVSALSELKINGENVEYKFNKGTGLWEFEHTLELENGYHSIDVYSKDAAGNKLSFAHKVFIDSEAPVLDVEDLPAQTTEDSVVIKGTATDNFPYLKVVVNGNVVKTIEAEFEYFDTLDPASYEFEGYEVELEDGENTIVMELIDAMGNITTKQVTVNKVDEIVDEVAPGAPAIKVVDGNVVITATDEADTAKLQYSFDNKEWHDYAEPIVAEEGMVVYAIAVDAAGNKSEVATFEVGDITAPKAPAVTEKDGVVTIEATDEDTSKLEYSLDGKTWVPYTEPVKVSEKATIYARAIDAVTNISEVVEYTVPDRTAPQAPKMDAKKNMVTITAKDEDVVKIEYSLDKKEWKEYKDPVKLAAKKTMYARAIDGAGNVSPISKLTMPDSGNTLPQTGGVVGSGLLGLGGVVSAAFGALMLKKRNRK